MTDRSMVSIRLGAEADIPAIVSIEQQVYHGTGCTPFIEDHVRCWLDTHPDGFLVAEKNDAVKAFCYLQLIDFNPADQIPCRTYDELTDHGYSRATHKPDGNTFCMITLDSLSPGVGLTLIKNLGKHITSRGKPYAVGTSRISGFSAYLEKIHNLGIINKDLLDKDAVMKIALWYAAQTVKRTRGTLDSTCPRIPELDLPAPGKSDPILGFYTGNGLSMHSVYPDFLEDAQSRNFSVIVVYRSPCCFP
ncbi:MAG: hypothetical protein NTW66_02780 [Candidatus Magasanikbacteria bacterium]|nr:hypothetical protein [Candidatus Magasanikbacteria bacterium]